jgi:hypothetical protein
MSATDPASTPNPTTTPVFIVGAPRSGTSLLYRLLQFHDAFAPRHCTDPTGVELTETGAFSAPEALLDPENRHVRGFMLNDSQQLQAFRKSAGSRRPNRHIISAADFVRRGLSRLDAPAAPRQALWAATGNDRLVRLFFEHAAAARGCRRLLEKTPQHIFYLPEIDATYADAQKIFLHRHPVDVFVSYKRRLADSRKAGLHHSALRWLELTPKQFCARYRRYMSLALSESARRPNNMLLLGYEDLVGDPSAQLSRLCDFLQEPYQDAMLGHASQRTSEFAEDPKLFQSVDASTPTWNNYLSFDEARYIDNTLKPIAERLAYTPRTQQ